MAFSSHFSRFGSSTPSVETPEERQRRMQSQSAQQSTNSSGAMRLAQQFTQPASGYMPPSRERQPVVGGPPQVTPPPAPPAPPGGVPGPIGGSKGAPPAPGAPPSPVGLGGNGTIGGFQYGTVADPRFTPPPAPDSIMRSPLGGAAPARPTPGVSTPPVATPSSANAGPTPELIPLVQGGPQRNVFERWLDEEPVAGGVPAATLPPEAAPPVPPTGGPADVVGALNGAPPWGGQPDFSQWDTDGYAKPGHVAANPGPAPAGWDPVKWADPNHQSPKYVVGRILNQYPATTEGLKQALPELQRAYPGAKLVGPGDIDLGFGDGAVDVLIGAAQGGRGWTWIDQAGAAAGAAPPADTLGSAPPGTTPPVSGGGGVGPVDSGGTPSTGKSLNDILRDLAASTPEFTPGAGKGAMDAGLAALMRALGFAVPDAAGLKEASKETLLAQQAATRDQIRSQAAASGRGMSGGLDAAEMELGDTLGSNLTKSYRDIDLATQQQGFNNLTGVAGALSSHGQAEGSMARGDFAAQLAAAQQKFGNTLNVAELEQNARQFAEQMGFNFAQLSQQDRQFFQSLALNRWIAEKTQGNRELELLMGGLR